MFAFEYFSCTGTCKLLATHRKKQNLKNMIWLPGMPYTLYCNYGFTPLLYGHSTVARRLQVPVSDSLADMMLRRGKGGVSSNVIMMLSVTRTCL